jgi:hypothetical protein
MHVTEAFGVYVIPSKPAAEADRVAERSGFSKSEYVTRVLEGHCQAAHERDLPRGRAKETGCVPDARLVCRYAARRAGSSL